MSSALHYDHDEHGGYLGFSHARCNLRAGAIKGNRQVDQSGTLTRRHCDVCTAQYQPRNVRQRQCSAACRAASQPLLPLTPRQCTECQQTFTPNVATRLTCSIPCRKARTKRLHHEDPTWPARARTYQDAAKTRRVSRTW